MKVIVFLFLCLNTIFATDLVEIYRLKGIDAVKKQIERQLQKKSYWNSYLKNIDVSRGYYESIRYIIVCQKDKKNITLYKKEKNRFTAKLSKDVFIGKGKGDKTKEGDMKTPVGAYDLENKITKLDPFYGPLALVTSYPNTFDKIQNKNGHGIWIHGLPYDQKRDDFTKGCIALENGGVKELDSKIDYKKSVLLIAEKKVKNITKNEISTILSQVFQWRDAWKKSNIDKYLAFYSKDFKRYDGMNLKKFKRYKKRVFAKNEKKKIEFKNINIVPYPNALNKKMFKVVMDENYKTRYYKFKGKKELYIELQGDKMSILAEG